VSPPPGTADDRLAILELTSRLGLLADERDWAALEQIFTDPVEVDYTSLNGGQPQAVRPAELVGGWREALGGLQATHHLIAGQVITLDGTRPPARRTCRRRTCSRTPPAAPPGSWAAATATGSRVRPAAGGSPASP
jgi:hypothetical protein